MAEQSLVTANSTSTDATTTVVLPIVIPSVPVVTSTPVESTDNSTQSLGAADQTQTTTKTQAPNPPYSLALTSSLYGVPYHFNVYFEDSTGQKTSDYLTEANLTIGSTTYPMVLNKMQADYILDPSTLPAGSYSYSVYVETASMFNTQTDQGNPLIIASSTP